jgi:hypothetical protein
VEEQKTSILLLESRSLDDLLNLIKSMKNKEKLSGFIDAAGIMKDN